MVAKPNPLPLISTHAPATQAELADLVRQAYETETPVYPLGGCCSLDYGAAPKAKGWGLSTTNLARIVDYPARDMTITVEAGIRMADLQSALAAERQRLPVDAPQAPEATLGGVIAANASGPRRFGAGTMRDYVIGISAVDGRGTLYSGGGRVVKNVAGYDFCKLLTGSLGTVGVIAQATLKVRPIPEQTCWLACDLPDFDAADKLLAGLTTSQTTPMAVELLAGAPWENDPALGKMALGAACRLAVGFEGTPGEIAWLAKQLAAEWAAQGAAAVRTIGPDGGGASASDASAAQLWHRLAQFPVEPGAPLTVKANVLPSRLVKFVQFLRQSEQACSLVAHAGNGVVVANLPRFSAHESARWLIAEARPRAVAAGGALVVLGCEAVGDLTAQAVWGPPRDETSVMAAVKRQFDPRGVLNPGRFVFGA